MVTVILLAFAIVAGWPLLVIAAAAGVTIAPAPTMVVVVAVGTVYRWRQRRAQPGPDAEAGYLLGVASELAGGASLRAALGAAPSGGLAVEPAARAAMAGISATRVSTLLRAALPVNGRMAAAAWLLAAESGGPTAAIFHMLAAGAAREGELIRERRSLTAQARASAWVVAGLPVVLLLGTLLSGRLDPSDPTVAVVLATGVLLQGAGIAVVATMVRRAGT